MKKSVIATVLIIVAACLQGCVVIVDEESRRPREPKRPMPVDATIAEIDAAGKLLVESHKREVYEGIAERDPLSPEAQVHLVSAVFDNLLIESAKERLLLTLINNPSFCPEAEHAILENLDRLLIESDKRNILNAISQRKNQR